MALWPCCFFHSWVRRWTDGLFDDDFLMVPRWCPVGVCTMVNHRRPADWRGGGWRTIPKFVACGDSCSTAVDGWGDDVCVVRLSPPCVSLKEDQDPLTKRMIMGLWTYFNRLQQGLQPPVEGCRRNPQNSSLWMTMPRCLVLNGNGTCVKTGVISVAYVTKMSHWVQIARPSNHGLDVVSQCKSSHLDRSSAYCHHSLFISDIWLLKSHFFRLKTRPCQGVCNCPMYSFGLATRHGRGLDSVRISSRSWDIFGG